MPSSAAIKKNLVLFLLAKVVIVFGSSIYSFAIGLYVLAVTGSAVNFSITLLLTILPRIILAPRDLIGFGWKRIKNMTKVKNLIGFGQKRVKNCPKVKNLIGLERKKLVDSRVNTVRSHYLQRLESQRFLFQLPVLI